MLGQAVFDRRRRHVFAFAGLEDFLQPPGQSQAAIGALLALPLAAAALMLVEELRVELPGEAVTPADIAQRREDNRGEQEYERRAEHMPAAQAAAIAVKISGDRKLEEAGVAKEQGATGQANSPTDGTA